MFKQPKNECKEPEPPCAQLQRATNPWTSKSAGTSLMNFGVPRTITSGG
jgi:hypothetical protein